VIRPILKLVIAVVVLVALIVVMIILILLLITVNNLVFILTLPLMNYKYDAVSVFT